MASGYVMAAVADMRNAEAEAMRRKMEDLDRALQNSSVRGVADLMALEARHGKEIADARAEIARLETEAARRTDLEKLRKYAEETHDHLEDAAHLLTAPLPDDKDGVAMAKHGALYNSVADLGLRKYNRRLVELTDAYNKAVRALTTAEVEKTHLDALLATNAAHQAANAIALADEGRKTFDVPKKTKAYTTAKNAYEVALATSQTLQTAHESERARNRVLEENIRAQIARRDKLDESIAELTEANKVLQNPLKFYPGTIFTDTWEEYKKITDPVPGKPASQRKAQTGYEAGAAELNRKIIELLRPYREVQNRAKTLPDLQKDRDDIERTQGGLQVGTLPDLLADKAKSDADVASSGGAYTAQLANVNAAKAATDLADSDARQESVKEEAHNNNMTTLRRIEAELKSEEGELNAQIAALGIPVLTKTRDDAKKAMDEQASTMTKITKALGSDPRLLARDEMQSTTEAISILDKQASDMAKDIAGLTGRLVQTNRDVAGMRDRDIPALTAAVASIGRDTKAIQTSVIDSQVKTDDEIRDIRDKTIEPMIRNIESVTNALDPFQQSIRTLLAARGATDATIAEAVRKIEEIQTRDVPDLDSRLKVVETKHAATLLAQATSARTSPPRT